MCFGRHNLLVPRQFLIFPQACGQFQLQLVRARTKLNSRVGSMPMRLLDLDDNSKVQKPKIKKKTYHPIKQNNYQWAGLKKQFFFQP